MVHNYGEIASLQSEGESVCIVVRELFMARGGIGKSTIAANTAVALAQQGLKVLLIYSDPKADSARTVMGRKIKPVLEVLKQPPNPTPVNFLFKGFPG